MRIKIVMAPTGEAPPEHREAWVGLVLPATPFNADRKGLLGRSEKLYGAEGGPGREEHRKGYRVEAEHAVIALLNAGKTEAAEYWDKNKMVQAAGSLVFGDRFCAVIKS